MDLVPEGTSEFLINSLQDKTAFRTRSLLVAARLCFVFSHGLLAISASAALGSGAEATWWALFAPAWLGDALTVVLCISSWFASCPYIQLCLAERQARLGDNNPSILTEILPDIVWAFFGIIFVSLAFTGEVLFCKYLTAMQHGTHSAQFWPCGIFFIIVAVLASCRGVLVKAGGEFFACFGLAVLGSVILALFVQGDEKSSWTLVLPPFVSALLLGMASVRRLRRCHGVLSREERWLSRVEQVVLSLLTLSLGILLVALAVDGGGSKGSASTTFVGAVCGVCICAVATIRARLAIVEGRLNSVADRLISLHASPLDPPSQYLPTVPSFVPPNTVVDGQAGVVQQPWLVSLDNAAPSTPSIGSDEVPRPAYTTEDVEVGAAEAAQPPIADGDVSGEFAVGFLVPLLITVNIPEGADIDVGLSGVTIEVDGLPSGTTDSLGHLNLNVRAGSRHIRLLHPCFGPRGRQLPEFDALSGQRNELIVSADVRLIVFAAETEASEDGEGDGPGDTAVAEQPIFVWVAGSRDAVPEDVLIVQGHASVVDAAGSEVSSDLDDKTGTTELVLFSGEVDYAPSHKVRVDSFKVHAHRVGYIWRPKDPSPMVERADELGGSEYSRLLNCPLVMGFLEPAFKVLRGSEVLQELPVSAHSTLADVKTVIVDLLNLEEDRLRFARDGELLTDDARMLPFTQVHVSEMAAISVRVVVGCCGAPLPLAAIVIDGVEVGKANQDGRFLSELTTGNHEFNACYANFGKQPETPMVVMVKGNRCANEITISMDPYIYVYMTQPEEEEEEEGAKEENGSGDDAEKLFDPSCIWVATNAEQIPDEALPTDGRAAWSAPDGKEYSVVLDVGRVVPFRLPCRRHGDNVASSSRGCPLSSLRASCWSRGFTWSPKDPSPLVARTEELGGCELLRLMECPAVMGFLKPAVTVQCSSGELLSLPLDTFGEIEALRSRLAELLDEPEESGGSLQLIVAEGSAEAPITATQLKRDTIVLCARQGEQISVARKALDKWLETTSNVKAGASAMPSELGLDAGKSDAEVMHLDWDRALPVERHH